jgi:hypothetical protein
MSETTSLGDRVSSKAVISSISPEVAMSSRTTDHSTKKLLSNCSDRLRYGVNQITVYTIDIVRANV